jgi:hypothetical protein
MRWSNCVPARDDRKRYADHLVLPHFTEFN